MTERFEAIVSGRVQGVMFRDFVCRMAHARRIMGEVQNLRDGTVRVVAEGERDKLEELVAKLHHGPLLARPEQVQASWKSAINTYKDFTINYDRA
jgi:acylphosphatase